MSDKLIRKKIHRAKKSNKSLEAQLAMRSNNIKGVIHAVGKRKLTQIGGGSPVKGAIMLIDLKERQQVAAQARMMGAVFDYPVGNSHREVTKHNAEVRGTVYLESNHTPPNDCYVDSPFDKIPIDQRPAHAMHFYHHRSPSGRLGGASSTGGSGVNKQWSVDNLREYMKAGEYGQAMLMDIKDLLNTTAPNRGYYALGLWRAALYAKKKGLLNDEDFGLIGNLLLEVLPGNQYGIAIDDFDAANGSFQK